MKSIILILDDKDLQLALLQALGNDPQITTCNAHEAVDTLALCHPDAVVLDLFLAGTDGFSILEALAFRPPVTVMLTPLITGSILRRASDLGIYLVRYPCTPAVILSYLLAAYKEKKDPPPKPEGERIARKRSSSDLT